MYSPTKTIKSNNQKLDLHAISLVHLEVKPCAIDTVLKSNQLRLY